MSIALLVAYIVSGAPAARADTKPVDPADPVTVAADPLPTPQIDGVVWTQAVAGDRVYAGGDWKTVRPFGAAPGTNLKAQPYILAYSISTGDSHQLRAEAGRPGLGDGVVAR